MILKQVREGSSERLRNLPKATQPVGSELEFAMWSALNHSPVLPSVGRVLQCLNVLRRRGSRHPLSELEGGVWAGPTLSPENAQYLLLSR